MRFYTLNPKGYYEYWDGTDKESTDYPGCPPQTKNNRIYLGINDGNKIKNFDQRMMRFEKFMNMKKINKCRVYCNLDFSIIQNEIAVARPRIFALEHCIFSFNKRGPCIDGFMDCYRTIDYRKPRITTCNNKFRCQGKIVERAGKVLFNENNIYKVV